MPLTRQPPSTGFATVSNAAAARGRGAAFREGLRVDRALLDDASVVDRPPALVLGPHLRLHVEVVGKRARPQGRADMHVPGQRGRAAIAADLGGADRVGPVVGAEPALGFRDADAEEAGLVEVAVVLGREGRVAVMSRRPPGEDRLAHRPRPVGERRLFVAEAEGHGIEERRVERDRIEAEFGNADMGGHRNTSPLRHPGSGEAAVRDPGLAPAVDLGLRFASPGCSGTDARKSERALLNSRRSSGARCPTPSKHTYAAPGIFPAMRCHHRRGRVRVLRAREHERGAAMRGSAARKSKPISASIMAR